MVDPERSSRTVADPAPAEAPPLPRELQLEVTGACNLACRMCLVRYRPRLGKADGAMCPHVFRRVVDALPNLERLTLQGLGEPLLAPELESMVAYAAGRGVRVGFNTNGVLLTPDRARRLAEAGLDWLHVSLDGATAETYESIRPGSSFPTVTRNIQALMAVVAARHDGRPSVRLVFVLMRRNVHELPDLVRLASSWGVPEVWVQNLSHSFSDTDPHGSYAEIRRFSEHEALWNGDPYAADAPLARAREAADELGVILRLPRVERGRARRSPGEPGCDWPWRSAYVSHRGVVQPCCMVMGSDRAAMGDLERDPFPAIWAGEAYVRLRRGLLGDEAPEICRGCAAYRGVF